MTRATKTLTALLGVALLAAAPTPAAGEHRLTGNEARALALAFQTIGASPASGQGGSAFGGLTVYFASMPSCYRFRFVSNADPTVHSTLRFAKPQGDSDGSPCTDAPASETSLPGSEAEGIVRVVQAWSRGDLPGAPGLETLSSGAFTVIEKLNATGPTEVDIFPSGAACALPYSYAPSNGQVKALAHLC
jgi:hypothetical protein